MTSPGADISIAPRFLGITASLNALAIAVYVARMYSRIWPARRLGMDDWAMSIAVALLIMEWGLIVAAVHHGMGRHNYFVTPSNQVKATRLMFASQPLWVWSVALIKISVAGMMLRILRVRAWQLFLFATIAIQVISAIVSTLVLLLQCRPIAAIWDPSTPNAKCWDPLPTQISLYGNAAISIATDLIFSCLPVTFLHSMNLPLREKIVIGSLMGLGLFASAAGIVKTTLVKEYSNGGDNLWTIVDLGMWAFLEEDIGIIAACIPCLKALFERALSRLGLLTIEDNSHRGRNGYWYHSNEQSHSLSPIGTRTRHDPNLPDTESVEVILPSKADSIYLAGKDKMFEHS